MAQPYAAPGDLADLTVDASPTERQLQFLLDAAWVKLGARVPGLQARIDAGAVQVDAVRLVLIEMVQAVLRNPSGQRSGSETTGPFGRSWSWDPAAASGRLAVTEDMFDTLGVSSPTAYTVTTPFTPAWGP